jgi:hypothetical protein
MGVKFVNLARSGPNGSQDTYEMDPVYSDTATTFVGGCMAMDKPSKERSTAQLLVGNLFAMEGSLMKHIFALHMVTRVSPQSSGPEIPLNVSCTGTARSPSDHAAWYSLSCSRRLARQGWLVRKLSSCPAR